MNQVGKIALVQYVLDELATVGYLTCIADKEDSIKVIRELLEDFEPVRRPPSVTDKKFAFKYNKADVSILSMRHLARLENSDLNKQLSGLAILAEKTLSELLIP